MRVETLRQELAEETRKVVNAAEERLRGEWRFAAAFIGAMMFGALGLAGTMMHLLRR